MNSKQKTTLFLCFFCVVLVNNLFAQTNFIEPNKVSENLYFDETEIDLASWLSYYSWTIIHEGEEKAQAILPDSNLIEPELWKYIKNTTLTEYINVNARYSNHPIGYFRKQCQDYEKYKRRLSEEKKYCKLLNFPITGITYEQASAFCSWRTKIEGDGKYIFYLPTPNEWKELALFGFSENELRNGFKDSTYKRTGPNYNFNSKSYCPTCIEAGTLFGIAMFSADEKMFFDVYGNVSEMTSIKGVSKGGNFTLYANQCHPDSTQYYQAPQRWLGFRCVAHKADFIRANSSDRLIDERDNKSYPTVIIGKQRWMAANLAFKPDSGKYWVYDNDKNNANKYGYLYTWKTAQNVCPVGWHLPSKVEFEQLISLISDNSSNAYKNLTVYGASGLNIATTGSHVGLNFTPLNSIIILWVSTEYNKRRSWGLIVNGVDKKAYLSNAWNKTNGFPVRCIQDKEAP